MVVVYCDTCGAKIGANADAKDVIPTHADGKTYCAKCAPRTPAVGDEATGTYAALTEPAAAASATERSATKFYFCETCGKRVTDAQIEQGLGKDKKLKGVYCKTCAVGVSTMEFTALTDVKLRESPEPAASASPSPPPQRSDKARPSGLHASTPKAAKDAVVPRTVSASGGKRAKSSLPVVAGVGVAIAVLLGGAWWLGRAPAHDKQTLVDAVPTPPLNPIPVPPPPVPASNPIVESPAIPITPAPPHPTDAESQAQQAYDALLKFDGLKADDTAARLAAIDAFLKIHGETIVAARARTLAAEFKKSADAAPLAPSTAPVPVAVPKPVETAEPEKPLSLPALTETAAPLALAVPATPAVVAPVDTGRQQFAGILKELAPLLRQNKFTAAVELLDARRRDPGFASAVELIDLGKSDVAELQSLRKQAMDALRAKAGTTVTLKKGTMTGTIKADANKDSIALALKDGPEFTITTAQLDADDIHAALPIDTGAGKGEDLRRHGLLYLAAGEMFKAEDFFAKARDAGKSAQALPYLERIAALKQETRDAEAADAWKKAEALFTSRNWTAAKKAYESFQHDFAGSMVLTANAETLKGRLEAITDALAPPKELSLDLGGGVKLELVAIPAGEFMLGSNDGEAVERPVHKVKITKPFYMGKFVVTQAQFEKVVGKHKSNTPGDDLPVDLVMFNDAEEFCKKATKLLGRTVRLPTEAEWEYACRAGTKTKYNIGDDDTALALAGWTLVNSEGKTHPVGQKKPNAWGLYDMHGNVWQWCQDWFGDDYYASSPVEDPAGPPSGPYHVLRGSSWLCPSFLCRQSFRHRFDKDYAYRMGLRVVVPLRAP